MSKNVNKWLFAGFVLFGMYHILVNRDYSDAAINFGIALAFDPFDQAQPWKERPMWQRAWLIIHLGIIAALFGYEVGFNDAIS